MYAPPYSLVASADLGHSGELRTLRFAPERGVVPVKCLAALLPRESFGAKIVELRNRKRAYSAVVDVARASRASVVVNGGFFDFDRFVPDGLLVLEGKTLSNARADYSTAIDIDRNGVLAIVPTDEAKSAAFAVQGHPALVDAGGKMGMHSEEGSLARRTFVAQSGETVIVAITSEVTLYHLADALVQYPDAFGCTRIDAALNLSGDESSGFYARLADGSEAIERATWPAREVLVFSPRA